MAVLCAAVPTAADNDGTGNAATKTGGAGGNTAQKEQSTLRFEAGSKEFLDKGDHYINRFYNTVTAWHRDAVLKAREGVYNSGTGDIRFYGETSFRDSLRQVFADTLLYNEHSRKARAIGSVKVQEGDRMLSSDELFYDRDLQHIIASGVVFISDDSTQTVIRGETAEFSDSTGVGLITGSPRLEKIDDNDILMTVACRDSILFLEDERRILLWPEVVAVRDSLTLSCSDTLEIRDLEKTVRLWKNVVALQDSLRAYSDYASWDDSTEVLLLTDNPRIEYRVRDTRDDAPSALSTLNTVTGDSIRVDIRDREVQGAVISGSATSVTASVDSSGAPYDKSVIESMIMRLLMEDGAISEVTAGGTAQSYYFRNYAGDDWKFTNNASGDTLTFFFDEGSLAEMKIYGYGGSPGYGKYLEFRPEKPVAAVTDSTAADN